MCVCVCQWRAQEGVCSGGVKSKVRGVKKYHKGLSGKQPAFSQDLIWIPLRSVGLSTQGPPGDTDGQHVEGKRRGYDLLPCGEKSMGRAPMMRPNWIKARLNVIQIFSRCPGNAVSISGPASSKTRPLVHSCSAWSHYHHVGLCLSPFCDSAIFFRSAPPSAARAHALH